MRNAAENALTIYVLAMRTCTSVEGAEMTFRKPVGQGLGYVMRRRS